MIHYIYEDITEFYKIYLIDDTKSLLLTLNSVSLLFEKKYLTQEEQKDTKLNIMKLIKLDELLEKVNEVDQNLETIKYLIEEELITNEYYENKKNELLEKM